MWQMALSMKIFGVSEYAIRYPSVLMGAIMVLLTYRVAILFFKNNTIAFTAALFMCLSNYQFELTSGYFGMDHNDVAFGFYVLASIWSYAEYSVNKKWKWVVLIGIFAGCAVLNKWLTGLLVYSGWGINILLNIRKQGTRKEILQMLISLLVCIAIFLPWQLYIHHAFPKEALYEMQYNARHITEVIEGHDGNTRYYIDRLSRYYGLYTWWLFPVGIIIALTTQRHHRYGIITSLSYILIVFIFFSVIVQSKLLSYVFPVAPLGFMYMAIALHAIFSPLYRLNKYLIGIPIFAAGFLLLNTKEIVIAHNPDDGYRIAKTYNTNIYKHIREHIPADIKYIMNLNSFEDVELMFYNKGITAYHYVFSDEDFKKYVADKNIKTAIFASRAMYPVSDYVKSCSNVYWINIKLK